MNKKQKRMLARIIVAALALVILHFVPVTGWLRLVAYLAVYLVIGFDILKKAGWGIAHGRALDENFLMTVATLGAFGLAIWQGSGDYDEGIAVMLFYQIGELFQSYAVGKSRRNIGALMDIRPDCANIECEGELVRVDPSEVEVGSLIVVLPGERIPIDGIVESGESTLNTAALTGESLPRDVKPGDRAVSGCINLSGVIKVRTEKEFGDSTVSRILDMVENASSRKSRSEAFISRFARIYTPVVCGTALLLALAVPGARALIGLDAELSVWLYRALSFLVVSCPCALVISIPLSFFAGIGGASRRGILIKGSNYLEELSHTTCAVFDKTGTLTEGSFRVTGIFPVGLSEGELLELAAHAEAASSHPVARSIRESYGAVIDLGRVSGVEEIGGHGIRAEVDGRAVAIGNIKLMTLVGVEPTDCRGEVGTVIHVAVDGAYAGRIVISDVVKPTSREAMEALRRVGVKRTVMLTGDTRTVAEAVAADLGIDEFRSELLPADKVSEVEALLSEQKKGEKLVFVGDGINDAPVLTRADIGIAMGAMGSDAAIEAADIVLMDDDPRQLARAIGISRKCIGIVRQNIVFSLAVKLACLILTAFGVAGFGMWAAIFADVGVMVLAVLNSIRALSYKK